MNDFGKVKREIRDGAKHALRLYRNGEISEDTFRLLIMMAMSEEIYIGLEDKVNRWARNERQSEKFF